MEREKKKKEASIMSQCGTSEGQEISVEYHTWEMCIYLSAHLNCYLEW